MNLTNKLIAGLTAMAVVASNFAFVPTLSVHADSAENTMAYEWALDNGLTSMSSFSAFNPEGYVTRESAARFLTQGADALGADLSSDQECSYTDLASADQSLVEFINDGCAMGIFKAQSAFDAKGLMTRAQAELTVARIVYGMDEVAAYADDNNMSEYAAAREMLMADDIVKVEIPANSSVKRLHLVLMLYRLANADETTPTTPTTPVAGMAEVSLASTSTTMSVPKNASSVKVGTITLTAGANDTNVSSIVITRSGLGNVADISSVQLVGSNGMATDARTMSTSSQSATLKFTNVLTLKAGTSMNFDALVSLSGAENNYHTFTVSAVNVVNGTATGTPLTLSTLNTSSYLVKSVSVDSLTQGTVTAGKTNQTFATVKLTPNADATVNGFTISKGAGEDYTKVMANLKAYHNNVMVGTVTVTTDKIIVSNLNLARLQGEQASIELKGDAVYVGPALAIGTTFKIAESTDVSATEKVSGYIMPVSGFGTTATLPLGALDLTLTKISTGSRTVAPGTSSVELFNAKVTSDATFDVSAYNLSITGTDLTRFVDNKLTVYINGVDYEMTSATKSFTASADRFRVESGSPVVIRVVGNIRSNATGLPADYTTTFNITEVKNVSNGQTVAVTKSLQGDKVTVGYGTYTVQKPSSMPTNKTVLEGSTSDMLYFNLRAASENQVLKSVKVTSTKAFDTYATKVALMQGTTELKSITSSTDLALTSYNFDSLTTTLQQDVTTPFTVRVTLKNGEVTNLGTGVMLSLAASADVVIARSADQGVNTTTTSTFPLNGNTLQISSAVPSIKLPTQVNKNTTIEFNNGSSYDVVITSFKAEMTRNLIAGGNYAAWGTSPTAPLFLDAVNGSSAGTVAGTAPGTITFTPTTLTVSGSPVARVIELIDNVNTVTDADYTVTVKEVTYYYVDRTDASKVSASITESVNESK